MPLPLAQGPEVISGSGQFRTATAYWKRIQAKRRRELPRQLAALKDPTGVSEFGYRGNTPASSTPRLQLAPAGARQRILPNSD